MAEPDSLDLLAMDLLEEALDELEQDREAWIAGRAGENEALRERTLDLLYAERGARGSVRTGGAPATVPADDPEHIGVYRIVRALGRGGMGAVYLGARSSGDFDHQVAIKLIKPGALSEALIERFRHERQILAALSHPHIAQLFDGGETEAGEPYFVMELVDGVALSQWFEANDPSLDQRLEVFAQSCAAVSFAHQSLIIHRDLTPSNILVTQSGQAKLIDFGISRPAEDAGLERQERGSLTNFSLSPGYAAPERQSGAAATTLSDVYSLGKVLAVLVGQQDDADLDAIIAKAVAEDPEDRYPSADALADDIERYRAGLPVPARKGGRRYVWRKFYRRHRAGVIAASAGLALLIGAFAATLVAYDRAESARTAEEARFGELRSLANYMLFDHNDRLERIVGTVEARVELADRAQTYLAELAASDRADDALKLETAQGFIKLARIRGVPVEPNLGQRDQAGDNLDEAIRLLGSITDPAVEPEPDLATALALRAMVELHGEGEIEGSAATIVRAASTLAGVPRDQRSNQWFIARGDVRKAQLEQATIDGRNRDVMRLARTMERETAAWPEPLRDSYAARLDRGYAGYYLASGLGHIDDATPGEQAANIPAHQEADRRFRALDSERPDDPLILYMLTWTNYIGAGAATNAGDPREGRRFLTESLSLIRRLLARESNDQALRSTEINIMNTQSQMFAAEGKLAQAVEVQLQVIARTEAMLTPKRLLRPLSRLAHSTAILGNLGHQSENRSLACDNWRKAQRLYAEIDRRGEQDYTAETMVPYLVINVGHCDNGRPASRFEAFG